ncbi:glutamate--tRNA ligase [candidate division KSB1 bacterium]|nr:glutamate--tRNA ligase [candidate division KSB1 bacterium]
MKPRTRFAPSPTGFVHVGGLRTALYNYLFAKNNGGTFILRIEDTDRSRYVEGAVENLLEALEWAGLIPDEGPVQGGDYGPYYQSERTDIYLNYARQLVENGHAYYAFDTPEDLEAMRQHLRSKQNPNPKYDASVRGEMKNSLTMTDVQVKNELEKGTPRVIRLKVPEDRTFEFDDIIRGTVARASSEIDDQVLVKSDGYPTYHLANVVDDHLMQITHVIRGEEWLSSVPKHLLLYESLGWQPPVMAHLPLIFNPDGSKMSKRDIQSLDDLPQGKVDPDVASYIKKGYEKQAIINCIALLGWNPGEGDERQVFSLNDLVAEFSLQRVNKAAAIFDLQKLDWLNAEHIKARPTVELLPDVRTILQQAGIQVNSDDYLLRVIDLLKIRMHFMADFADKGAYFFRDPVEYDPDVLKKRWKDDSVKLLLEFCKEIVKLSPFTASAIESALRELAECEQVGGGRIIHPVRLAVSGTGVGPGLFEMLEVLGADTVVRRIKTACEKIPALKQ